MNYVWSKIAKPFKERQHRKDFRAAMLVGDMKAVRAVIERCPTAVNWASSDGVTPLHRAVSLPERFHDAEYFLAHGAEVDARDVSGTTPLGSAVYFEVVEAMQLLINHHADLNAQDKEGRTPLMEAVLRRKTEAVELLIERGARLDLRNNEGQTARDLMPRGYTFSHLLEQAEAKQLAQAQQEKRKLKDAAMAVFHTGLPHDLRRPKLRLKKKMTGRP